MSEGSSRRRRKKKKVMALPGCGVELEVEPTRGFCFPFSDRPPRWIGQFLDFSSLSFSSVRVKKSCPSRVRSCSCQEGGRFISPSSICCALTARLEVHKHQVLCTYSTLIFSLPSLHLPCGGDTARQTEEKKERKKKIASTFLRLNGCHTSSSPRNLGRLNLPGTHPGRCPSPPFASTLSPTSPLSIRCMDRRPSIELKVPLRPF